MDAAVRLLQFSDPHLMADPHATLRGVPTLASMQRVLAHAGARRLNIEQPPLSQQIRALETELGVRLFERSTRRCHITPRGRTLVSFAQRVLELARTLRGRSAR